MDYSYASDISVSLSFCLSRSQLSPPTRSLSLPPSFSLTAEELRGFKFAPLRGMQREIEIRGWYDKVIRKKRTAQNKRIIMYKEKKNPSQMNALETTIRDNVEMELV